jgi:hypothetical protein
VDKLQRKVLIGRITVVQEERIRFVTDDGRGFLFTLARDFNLTDEEIRKLSQAHSRLCLEYSGTPNTVSGLAHEIQNLKVGSKNQRI